MKVESRQRPDAMREGEPALFGLLNQGKANVSLDFAGLADRRALLALIAESDIVIEAARPRALLQLDIDAAHLVGAQPGLIWITITGHGADGDAADWVGFGDDCGVAGGLSAALEETTGRSGFVGDAIADPLTGIAAAAAVWDAWSSGRSGRFGVAMSAVAASCLAAARASDPTRLEWELRGWAAAEGRSFPQVNRRPAGSVRPLGADNRTALARVA
jgi:crotonobetainyl-CoA:carnitine CoA-transferase CaiB-like acyl-CoA transferase